ncbi:hypothetical protein CGLO_17577 [Colletotrichum gloeosporioides Cg-14]|uniref:Uncharacterized protein n=1 Tax=Colletotrichum gloeosporioides (strain Cg-14) TaxID=1237896 RepID=T0L622_COLGC|nr:hypothetical protein CGLO_17577 [Colletotrichum gloeosporioides Cg-14]
MAQAFDPKGVRTMSVLTKRQCNKLSASSSKESDFDSVAALNCHPRCMGVLTKPDLARRFHDEEPNLGLSSQQLSLLNILFALASFNLCVKCLLTPPAATIPHSTLYPFRGR